MDTQDLTAVTSACPNLRCLGVVNALQHETDLELLLQLPACCAELHVGGRAFEAPQGADVVRQLTRLTRLHWLCCPGLMDEALEELTELQGLQVCYQLPS